MYIARKMKLEKVKVRRRKGIMFEIVNESIIKTAKIMEKNILSGL